MGRANGGGFFPLEGGGCLHGAADTCSAVMDELEGTAAVLTLPMDDFALDGLEQRAPSEHQTHSNALTAALDVPGRDKET